MPTVKEVVGHIRKHVVAEAAERDPTQTVGMDRRAQLVLDAVESLRGDLRDLLLRDILVAIHDLIPQGAGRTSFRRAMVNMLNSDERTPWQAIMEWVARGRESLADDFQRDD